jgi:hypothetical protein
MEIEHGDSDWEGLCGAALEAVRGLIPPERYQDAHDWIYRYAEHVLAMEFVIDSIADLEQTVNDDQFRAIQAAMTVMGHGDSHRMRYLATIRS